MKTAEGTARLNPATPGGTAPVRPAIPGAEPRRARTTLKFRFDSGHSLHGLALLLPVWIAGAATLVSGHPAAAQSGSSPVGGLSTRPPFAQFVPASAAVFVEVSGLDELRTFMAEAHAEKLIPILTGKSQSGPPFDPDTLLKTFLGPTSRFKLDELSGTKFGFAARSWSEFADGVFFVHMPEEGTLNRWFPDAQQRATRISPFARLLRVEEATICTRGLLMAASRDSSADSLMRETLRLMAGRVGKALYNQGPFQRLLSYLPAKPLAIGYFRGPQVEADDDQEIQPGSDLSVEIANEAESMRGAASNERAVHADDHGAFSETIVAVYARDGRIEVAVRANRASEQSSSRLSANAFEQLGLLPQSTLVAWAGRTLRGDDNAAGQPHFKGLSEVIASLHALLDPEPGATGEAGLRGAEPPGEAGLKGAVPPDAGAQLILAWDSGSTGEAGLNRAIPGDDVAPQIALLVESEDARGVNARFGRIVERVVDRLYAMDPVGPENSPAIRLRVHGDVPISTLSLKDYAAQSKWPGSQFLQDLEPSWSAAGNWWVLTLTREHLERILDAQAGRLAPLRNVPDVRSILESSVKRSSIVITQTRPAAVLLDRWIAQARVGFARLNPVSPGDGSSSNPGAWDGGAFLHAIQPDRLGIGVRSRQEPGVVVVARVDPNTAADGKLLPEDRIIGIDGQLLDLSSPNSDFRKRWHQVRWANYRTVRVQRNDEIMDVVLEFEQPEVQMPAIGPETLNTVTELVRIGREIAFAGYVEMETDPRHYAALFSIRLAPPTGQTEAAAASIGESP